MDPSATSNRWRRLGRLAVLPAVVTLAAVWIDLGRFHDAVVPDALIPILSSLYAWEPFFWEQTRIGSLFPLLAQPISNPWHNLLFQTWLSIVAGLTLLALMVRYIFGRRGWRPIAIVSIGAFLFVAPASAQYLLLSTTVTYGIALSFGFAALSSLRSDRQSWYRSVAVALVLSIIAHWLNGVVALLLVPLVVIRGALEQRREQVPRAGTRPPVTEGLAGILILVAGFAAGQLLAWASPYPLWHLHVLNPEQWPEAWSRLAVSTWNDIRGPWSTLLLASSVAGLAIGFWEHRRGRTPEALRMALPLYATAVTYWLMLGASEWVKLNHYHSRYAMPAVWCLHTAAVATVLIPLTRLSYRWRNHKTAAAVLLLACSIASTYGLPSPARAREAVDERLGGLSEDVRDGGVTHVLGSYGTVWTTVYHSNLLRYEARRPGVIWGVAHRAGPTAKYWRQIPLEQWRVGVKPNDRQWREIAELYGLPELIQVDQVGGLLILTPTAAAPGPDGDERP